MNTRRGRLALAAIAATIASLVTAAPALAKTADVTDADVALRLAKNGDLIVTETLTFDYDGHFEGSYRDIVLKHGETITDVHFGEQGGKDYKPGANTGLGSYDRPGTFGVEEIGYSDTVRVVWHYTATDTQRTYVLSYRVQGGAEAYDDVIDVGWTVWGDQWDFDLDQLTASFTNPQLDPASDAYRVWGHPREVEGETVRGDGEATLEAEDVQSGTAVEFRVVFPRDPTQDVSGMRQATGDGLAKIVAAEQALDEDFNTPYKRFKRFVGHHAVLISLGLVGLAAGLLWLLAFFARERDGEVGKYAPEPPDDASPATAYALAHEGRDSANTVLATLLDLVDRGFYDSKEKTTDKEKLDLALEVKEDRPSTGELQPHEREVLEFFDQLLGAKTVALSEMRDKIPQHSALWRGRWETMTEKLDEAGDEELSWDRDWRFAKLFVILGFLAGIVYVTAAHADVEHRWFGPVAIGVLGLIGLFAFPTDRLRRISAEHSDRCARWRAFERWTEDFPKLSDDPPATLELWRRILVYGVAFGTASRMIESGRIPEPVIAASTSAGHWSTYAFAGSFSDSSFNASSFSSGFSSQVAPVTSSSGGGGGGFSGGGGGGGFSGGGGGGSW